MKKVHKPQILSNGIIIDHSDKNAISNATKSSIPFVNDIMLILLQILTGIGALMTLVSILCLQIENVYVYACVIISSIIYTVTFKLVKKYKSLVLLGVLLLASVYLIFKFDDVSNGFIYLYDQGYSTICKYMYFDQPVLAYEWSDDLLVCTNSAIGLLASVYMVFVCYFIVVKINFVAIFLLTFPCFELGAAFGCVPNYNYFSLMLASWVAMVALHQANNIKIKCSESKKKRRVFANGYVRFTGSSLVIAAITIGVFLGSRYMLNSFGFDRTEVVDALRSEVKSEAESLLDYISGEDNDGSMKDGQLLKVDDHNVKFRHHLTMETSLQEIKQPLYIKGFSGTLYNGYSWNQSENYDEYKKLFENMQDNGFLPQEVNSNLLFTTDNYDKYAAANITFKDFRRSKDYGYYLYNSSFDDNYTFIQDYTVVPSNPKEYSINAFLQMENMFDIDTSKIYQEDYFKDIQQDYADFANNEYTVSYATDNVKKLVEGFEYENTYALVDEVRDYLSQNIKYTFIVDKSPADVDFVDNFLFATKRGYSTHYATAAAVMLQAAGVPTRYVEGYCIPPDVFNNTETEHKYGYITMDVTDAYAHAWIEIYDEKFGWIPVDVTPNLYNGSFEDYMQRFVEQFKLRDKSKKEQESGKIGENSSGKSKDTQQTKTEEGDEKATRLFTMETSLKKITQPLYLKGLSFGVYNGVGWNQTPNYDKYNKLFDEMKESRTTTQEVNCNLLLSAGDIDKYLTANIKLKDFEEEKDYGYYLYNSGFDDNFSFVHDYAVVPNETNEYSFNAFLQLEYMFEIDSSKVYNSEYYKYIQKQYANFVKEEYTVSYGTDKVKEVVDGFEFKNTYALVDEIRDYLAKNTKYTFEVKSPKGNADFVESFLFETKKGYSTHYATAAAVMLQVAGVPARYVEGYCIPTGIFNNSETKHRFGYVKLDITDSLAHSWIEVYDYNFGWIPVEVTPGFYSGSFEGYMSKFVDLDSAEYIQEKEETEQDVQDEETAQESPKEDLGLAQDVSPYFQQNEELWEKDTITQENEVVAIEISLSAFIILCMLLGVICVLTLACLCIITAYIYASVRRSGSLSRGSPESRIKAAYLYLLKIAKAYGINTDFTTYDELSKNLSCGFVNTTEICADSVISIITKCSFSDAEVTSDEAAQVVAFAKAYANIAYKSIKNPPPSDDLCKGGRFKKTVAKWNRCINSVYKSFVFKYIKHLI